MNKHFVKRSEEQRSPEVRQLEAEFPKYWRSKGPVKNYESSLK